MSHKKVTVLGDGAFGTAIATVLADNYNEVTLWCYNKSVYNDIKSRHENTQYLPGVELAYNIVPTTSLSDALNKVDIIFEAIPVKHMRSVIKRCPEYISHNPTWVTLSKGIEQDTQLLPTGIIIDIYAQAACVHISGPSFAKELATKQPTLVSISAQDKQLASNVMQCIQTNYFSLIYTPDITGVQLCGALKNICALGMGFLVGQGYGNNTQSLFFHHAIEESKKFLHHMDANPETIYEPAGIGDYIITCYSSKSRNYEVGARLVKGQELDAIISETGYIPEGINTLKSITSIMQKHQIKSPLFHALHDIFIQQKSVDIASILMQS